MSTQSWGTTGIGMMDHVLSTMWGISAHKNLVKNIWNYAISSSQNHHIFVNSMERIYTGRLQIFQEVYDMCMNGLSLVGW